MISNSNFGLKKVEKNIYYSIPDVNARDLRHRKKE